MLVGINISNVLDRLQIFDQKIGHYSFTFNEKETCVCDLKAQDATRGHGAVLGAEVFSGACSDPLCVVTNVSLRVVTVKRST